MRKIILIPLFLITFSMFSQENKLIPDKKYYEAVDKWVAFQTDENEYVSGFIYIDEMAGFTFDMGVGFMIDENGKYIPEEKLAEVSIKHRLDESYNKVAIIPEKKLAELGVAPVPEWLYIYKSDEGTVSYLKNIGYHYNHVGGSSYAIEPLEKAYAAEPHYNGLEFELAFAYNATKQFAKAIPILEKALEYNPKDYLLYKEMGYALMNTEEFDKAEEIFTRGISISDSQEIKAEMAINMTHTFFVLNDSERFKKWSGEAEKLVEKGSRMEQVLKYLKSEWDKKNNN
ncbi:MAG: tetratricopeptide repeat protein [Flavobacteriaceae bacterium]